MWNLTESENGALGSQPFPLKALSLTIQEMDTQELDTQELEVLLILFLFVCIKFLNSCRNDIFIFVIKIADRLCLS